MNRAQFFRWMKRIATLDTIGYLPAPGTCATLVTLPALPIIKYFFSPSAEFFLLVTMTIASLLVINYAVQLFPAHSYGAALHADPPQIVLDEVVGCLWAFYGIRLTASNVLVGFVLFRFFDIVKPLGIHQLQKLPRAWGIVADDLLAGIYTALILYVCA